MEPEARGRARHPAGRPEAGAPRGREGRPPGPPHVPDTRVPGPPHVPDARVLLRHALETLTILDEHGRIVFSSNDADGLLGHAPGALVGTDGLSHVHPDDRACVAAAFAEILATPGAEHTGELRTLTADGGVLHVEARARNLLHDPAVRGVLFASHDVTPRVQAEDALRRSETRLRALVHGTSDVVLVVDPVGGEVTFASPAAEALFHLGPGGARDRGTLVRQVHPDDRPALRGTFAAVARAPVGSERAVQYRARSADGRTRWLDARVRNQLGVPGVDGFVVHAADVTERREAEDRLQYQATHDLLTGMPNRSVLMARLDEALARARGTGTPVALLFLDLDRLKLVNDSLGHEAGDAVLVEIARRVRSQVRSTDLPSRLAGDEYVVLCEATGVEDARMVARRLVEVVEQPIDVRGERAHVSVSVGLLVSDGDATAQSLLADADAAMYAAKQRGRGQVVEFSEALRHRAGARLRAERAVRTALEHDALTLAFQPVYDLATGDAVAVEALLRCPTDDGTVLQPDEFIRVVEETGLIVPVGDWVLDAALRDLVGWGDVAAGMRVAVNVSARQLWASDLAGRVADILGRYAVEPWRLTIEITESALLDVHDTTTVGTALRELTDLGCRLSIDDFGTGYSSLAHLRELPVAEIKVDRSFVRGLGVPGARDEAIADAVLRMASALGLDVVAEGVETAGQLAVLRRLGCRVAQGYGLCAPTEAAAVPAWLRRPPPLLAGLPPIAVDRSA